MCPLYPEPSAVNFQPPTLNPHNPTLHPLNPYQLRTSNPKPTRDLKRYSKSPNPTQHLSPEPGGGGHLNSSPRSQKLDTKARGRNHMPYVHRRRLNQAVGVIVDPSSSSLLVNTSTQESDAEAPATILGSRRLVSFVPAYPFLDPLPATVLYQWLHSWTPCLLPNSDRGGSCVMLLITTSALLCHATYHY